MNPPRLLLLPNLKNTFLLSSTSSSSTSKTLASAPLKELASFYLRFAASTFKLFSETAFLGFAPEILIIILYFRSLGDFYKLISSQFDGTL